MIRRPVRTLLAVLLMLGIAGCTGIPTSGPVFTSDAVAEEPGQSSLRAPGPRKDASPVQIVTGFLNAQAGALTTKSPAAGFEVAQQFLTSSGAPEWDPAEKVVVYRGDPAFHVDESSLDAPSTTVKGMGTLVGSVDEHGVYTEAAPGATKDLSFNLVRDSEGQWRIDAAEGLVLSDSNFTRVYRSAMLYFPTPDRAWFVPDQRWFPKNNWQTYAVRETLEGPSPWLEGSVVTVAPEGTALAIEAVPIEDTGPIRVQLTKVAAQASQADRVLLAQQLEAVLSGSTHRSVELVAGGELLDSAGGRPKAPRLAPDLSDAVVVSGDQVVRMAGGEPQRIESLAPLTGLNPTALAFDGLSAGGRFVLRDGATRIVTAPTAAAGPATLFEGDNVLPPTLDRFGLVWTGTQVQNGSLVAIDAKGTVQPVAVPWLSGRAVLAIRVAPDGARIAVVSDGQAGIRVEVAGIVRRDDGMPTDLSGQFRVANPLVAASQVVWVDQSTLGVLGRSADDAEPLVQLVPVGGQTRGTSAVGDARSIAASGGSSTLLLSAGDATLWSYGPASLWTTVATQVRLPTYAG